MTRWTEQCKMAELTLSESKGLMIHQWSFVPQRPWRTAIILKDLSTVTMFLILILSQSYMIYTEELSHVVLVTVLLDPGPDLLFCFQDSQCYFISFEIKPYEPFINIPHLEKQQQWIPSSSINVFKPPTRNTEHLFQSMQSFYNICQKTLSGRKPKVLSNAIRP